MRWKDMLVVVFFSMFFIILSVFTAVKVRGTFTSWGMYRGKFKSGLLDDSLHNQSSRKSFTGYFECTTWWLFHAEIKFDRNYIYGIYLTSDSHISWFIITDVYFLLFSKLKSSSVRGSPGGRKKNENLSCDQLSKGTHWPIRVTAICFAMTSSQLAW